MSGSVGGTQFGRYRLIRELGRGGEAVVHLAEDARLGRPVAVKIFPGLAAIDDPAAPARVRREVEMLSRLDHPGICRIHEAGVEGGLAFIAMSYVEGRSLEAARRDGIGILDAARAIMDAARVVHHAHAAGIVHGDLKPANLLLRGDQSCVVLDFGLAPILDASVPNAAISRPAGSLPYLAPECLACGPDARSDVYSLGCVLFELVTGRTPFVAPTRAAMVALLTRDEAPLSRRIASGVPRDLEAILAKALARDPAKRYPTAAGFADDLARFLRAEPVQARRPGAIDAVARLARRNPAAAGLVLFLFAFLTAVTWLARFKSLQLERNLVEAELQAKRATLAAEDAARHVARHERLADRGRLVDLETRASKLYPPRPDLVPALEAWLSDARALAGRLETHRRDLAEVRSRGSRSPARLLDPAVSGAVRREIADLRARGPAAEAVRERLEAPLPHVDEWTYADQADAAQETNLAGLVKAFEAFLDPDPHRGTIASVARRIEDARRVGELASGEHAATWARACSDIADRERCPKYGGLALAPQSGLLPLRKDPASGFWEFLHVLSGEAPRARDDGSWEITGATGIVLVLLPGGAVKFGSRRPHAGEPADGPHVDPDALARESPVGEARLEPFFVSKYEMTGNQWFRATGDAPGAASREHWMRRRGRSSGPAEPVTSVSWRDCVEALRRLGLELPTEVQWECAARAGTATPWWPGPRPESLDGREKFAAGVAPPVGLGEPNPFGLYDTLGGVAEWCRDPFGRYTDPLSPGDGERLAVDREHRMRRGGSYRDANPGALRVSARSFHPPETRRPDTGVRPARRVDPTSRPLPQ